MNRPVGIALVVALALGAALAACGDSPAEAVVEDAQAPFDCAYPAGPYGVDTGAVVADFTRVDGSTGASTSLSQLRRCGEATAPRLIVLRMVADFCGPCRWSAEHSNELPTDGVQWIDLLVRGTEGAPPTAADAARWSARRGATSVPTWLDPEITFAAADPALGLPAFVYVDPRTMTVQSVQTNPDGDAVVERTRQTLVQLAGGARTPPTQFPRTTPRSRAPNGI